MSKAKNKASKVGLADIGQLSLSLRSHLLASRNLKVPPSSTPTVEEEHQLFQKAMQEVTPLKPINHVVPYRPTVAAKPLQRWKDEQAVLTEMMSDDTDDQWVIETDDTLSYRRPEIGKDTIKKLRNGFWTVQAQCDLHGYRLDNAFDFLAQFLQRALLTELRCVRVIHGKGHGSIDKVPVLKDPVRRWLAKNSAVMAFVEARPRDGGSGVVLVLLRKKN